MTHTTLQGLIDLMNSKGVPVGLREGATPSDIDEALAADSLQDNLDEKERAYALGAPVAVLEAGALACQTYSRRAGLYQAMGILVSANHPTGKTPEEITREAVGDIARQIRREARTMRARVSG